MNGWGEGFGHNRTDKYIQGVLLIDFFPRIPNQALQAPQSSEGISGWHILLGLGSPTWWYDYFQLWGEFLVSPDSIQFTISSSRPSRSRHSSSCPATRSTPATGLATPLVKYYQKNPKKLSGYQSFHNWKMDFSSSEVLTTLEWLKGRLVKKWAKLNNSVSPFTQQARIGPYLVKLI